MSDWADEKAAEIYADARCAVTPTETAIDLIASKLRLIRIEGEGAGLEQASHAMDAVFGRKSA